MLERRFDARGQAPSALFADAAQRVPVTPAELGIGIELRAELGAQRPGEGASLSGTLDVHPCRGAARCAQLSPDTHALFPDRRGGVEIERIDVSPDAAGGFRVALAGRTLDAARPRLTGVLALVDAEGRRRSVELDLDLRAPGPAATLASGATGLAQAIAFALLGGLILNLMPCVLPVLALKAVAIADLARPPRRSAARRLAYLAGVVASPARSRSW